MPKLTAGAKAPDFRLPDHDGNMVSLKDFKGRRVVIYFYPKDDTPGCTKEASQFSDLRSEFGDLGTEVLGISPDGAQSHQAFRGRYELAIRLLSDPDHKVMEAYGAWGEKTLYGRTSMGVIRSTFLISEKGTIERAWYNVRADGHAAAVLQALSS